MESSDNVRGLSSAQKAHIERNRQRALLLKQARLSVHPYMPDGSAARGSDRERHTGSGFFLEDKEDTKPSSRIQQQPGPILAGVSDEVQCEDCGQGFLDSYLFQRFDLAVCDTCRENDEKYSLVTKTDAKKRYLLKDADFDLREPPLKFILRKNPHNTQWGDMKLFLETQVQARALQVWGGEEELEKARTQRVIKSETAKKKRFDKRVKELRRAVRSSTWRKELSAHEHDYGAETYNEESEEYTKTCHSCGHILVFEKM